MSFAVVCLTVLLLFCDRRRPRVEVCMDGIHHCPAVPLHWLGDLGDSSCITWSLQVLNQLSHSFCKHRKRLMTPFTAKISALSANKLTFRLEEHYKIVGDAGVLCGISFVWRTSIWTTVDNFVLFVTSPLHQLTPTTKPCFSRWWMMKMELFTDAACQPGPNMLPLSLRRS